MKNYIVKQHDERDCGAACLAMVSAFFGRRMDLSECRKLTKTDRTGTNIYGLVDAADKIGLKGEAFECTHEDFRKELFSNESSGQLHFPLVMHVVHEGFYHFIVLFSFSNGKYVAGDPARGQITLTEDQLFDIWTGRVVTFVKTDRFKEGNFRKNELKWFLQLFFQQTNKIAVVIILSVLVAAIGIAGTFVFQYVIGGMTDGQISSLSGISTIFIALIALYLLQAILSFARGRLVMSVSAKIDMDLTLSYYNHLIGMPVESIFLRQTGDYLARFEDASAIRDVLGNASVTIILDVFMVAACSVILLRQNVLLFLIVTCMLLIYICIMTVFRSPMRKSNQNYAEANSVLQSGIKETLDGAETIKANAAEQFVKNSIAGKYHRYLDAFLHLNHISLTQETLTDLVQLTGTAAMLWAGFALVLRGRLSLGSLLTFYALLAYYMMLGSKGLLTPTYDTQHAHFVCNVLLTHSQLSSFFVKK